MTLKTHCHNLRLQYRHFFETLQYLISHLYTSQKFYTNPSDQQQHLLQQRHEDFYLNQINQEQSIHIPTKEKLKQYLNQLNGLSISGVETFKNDISNLVSELNSLESKINDAKSYSISYQLPFSILIETDSLIREEKDWFAKTSCKNIPTN